MVETWLPVVGHEGYYEVSNFGNIRAVRYNNFGEIVYARPIKSAVRPKGYLTVVLSKQSCTTNHLVHRLVAKAFIPNPMNLPEVNHLDGNKSNNSVSNLAWCTASENIQHAYDTGLKLRGKRTN
jgi:hypothetical protein